MLYICKTYIFSWSILSLEYTSAYSLGFHFQFGLAISDHFKLRLFYKLLNKISNAVAMNADKWGFSENKHICCTRICNGFYFISVIWNSPQVWCKESQTFGFLEMYVCPYQLVWLEVLYSLVQIILCLKLCSLLFYYIEPGVGGTSCLYYFKSMYYLPLMIVLRYMNTLFSTKESEWYKIILICFSSACLVMDFHQWTGLRSFYMIIMNIWMKRYF